MLKISLISLGLILGGTVLASAQSYAPLPADGNWAAPQQTQMQEGREVYVAPRAYDDSSLRLGSFSRETRQEEEQSNAPAH